MSVGHNVCFVNKTIWVKSLAWASDDTVVCIVHRPEIAASEIKKGRVMDESLVKEKSVNEEQTVYAQAIHYTTRMVSVLIPMDFKPDRNGKTLMDGHGSDMISNSISNSVADTDSIDAESGFDDSDTPNDNGLSVIKFVSRFVDKEIKRIKQTVQRA